jgi:hypothetical protein
MLLLATLLLGILANANMAKATINRFAKGLRQEVDQLQRKALGLAKGGWFRGKAEARLTEIKKLLEYRDLAVELSGNERNRNAQLRDAIKNYRNAILKNKVERLDDRVTLADMDVFAPEAVRQEAKALSLLNGRWFGGNAENRLKEIRKLKGYEDMEISFQHGLDEQQKLNQIRQVIQNRNTVEFKLAKDKKISDKKNLAKAILKTIQRQESPKHVVLKTTVVAAAVLAAGAGAQMAVQPSKENGRTTEASGQQTTRKARPAEGESQDDEASPQQKIPKEASGQQTTRKAPPAQGESQDAEASSQPSSEQKIPTEPSSQQQIPKAPPAKEEPKKDSIEDEEGDEEAPAPTRRRR